MSKYSNKKSSKSEVFVNDRIRGAKIRVISETGENLGPLSRAEAFARANELSLDLVQIGQDDDAPIAKIMDFGKHLYLKKKQQNEAKKHQKVIQIKEVKLRPNIGDQDYQTKLNRAYAFLKDGKRVKFTLQFRGRERAMMNEKGHAFFERIKNDVAAQELGVMVDEKESRGGPFWSKIIYIKDK